MNDVLKEAYERCVIGASVWVTPPIDERKSLDAFQAVFVFAAEMQKGGRILIRQTHRESMTVARMIDRFQITRLR